MAAGDAVDLSTQHRKEGVRHVWWDKANAPKVAWAELRRELTVVVRVQAPKKADVTVEGRLVTCAVEDAKGSAFRVELPLKGDISQAPEGREVTVGSTSVRIRLRKEIGYETLWQEDPQNNTCLDLPSAQTKSWLAYDWEVYKDDDDEDDGEEPAEQPAEEKQEVEEEEVAGADGDQAQPAAEPGERKLRDDKEQELRREAEEVRRLAAAQKPRQQRLQFQMGQLLALMAMVSFFCAVATFLCTRWLYMSDSPACVPPPA
eukprot:TRINITY_DN21342_c0_g1_i1.p1 TRINITY_DN21342_c0_g1~~TRINITY_DN21342_c0_g1_i1.p1  ORF type:complete len:284 (+),score=119.30 TRINITY_DN21342_c0_g1_i1:73-852(+)